MRRRVLAIALAGVLIACGGGSGGAHQSPTTGSTAPTTVLARPFTVTRRDVVVEDTTRTTNADPNRNLPEKPSRTLPLMLLTPDGTGPFPIVEFSHGVNATGPIYEPFLKPIAAAGYVIVAPTFPLSSGRTGTIFDYGNQPGDVYFAIDAVLKLAADPADPLHGRVDADRIAVAGHSLGAMTTIGAAFNSCCTQSRIDAAISISGVEAPFPNGDFANRPPVPLLLAHGAADTTIVVDGSDRLFAASTGPTAFLRFPDGTHSGILGGDDGTILRRAIVAWLDRWLRDDRTGLAQLQAAVDASGVASLQTRGL